jgi:hypothetical protein
VERNFGPMDKDRIDGGADQRERASDREALVTNGRCRKSGSRAAKGCVLALGSNRFTSERETVESEREDRQNRSRLRK